MKQTIRNIRNSALVPYHWAMGFLAANHYDYPASAMTVIGVTGTNGKTSTCFMIYNVLLEAGYKVGLMTTVGSAINREFHDQMVHMTTADTRVLNKNIAAMRDAGVQYLVLEVSSHALAQGRVFGVPIDIAVMTNVTPEHLDYHRTFARYRAAKCRLFKMAAQNAKHGGRGVGVVNADDPNAKWFIREVPTSVTYGIDGGDLRASRIKLTTKGCDYYTRIDKQAYHIKVNIPGQFYVYNSLAAVAACHALGLGKRQIEQGIADMKGVEGRMNHVDTGLGFDVIIDYAHTPDSYRKLIPDIKKLAKGKIIIVCGAAGQRDSSKFAEMGKLAGEYADLLILTEEDPRGPVRSLSELLAKGARRSGKIDDKDLLFIDDRTKAIETAVAQADKGDVVLLLGKGHEKTMERAGGQVDPWNEREVAEAAIEQLTDKPKRTKEAVKTAKSTKSSTKTAAKSAKTKTSK